MHRGGGACVGLFVQWGLAPNVDVRTEALFTLKGLRCSGTTARPGAVETYGGHAWLGYAEVPVTFRLSTTTSSGLTPTVFLGLYGARAIEAAHGGPLHINYSSGTNESYRISNTALDVSPLWDWGLVGGVGAGIDIGKHLVEFELRYSYGLQPIDVIREKGDASLIWSGTNRALTFSVGYGLRLG